ncbi:hypothetical protein [Dielma fastidiosa]|uniref:hypothetical protein n=1 Tax=Dielma fastidiosa TaxID=1034346 RepID=UPI0023F33B83|nr:hypothetical protein [Dielma fastidiosa]
MERIYAQVLKEDMKVNLIGGKNEGLPITHPSVMMIDITEREDRDSIKVSMVYDAETDIFSYIESEPPVNVEKEIEATQLDRMEANIDYLVMMK